MRKKLLNIYNYLDKNLIVIIASLAILISPFVVDYSNLPKGYELPKVHFLVALSAVMVFLGFIKYLENLYFTRKFKITVDFIIFGILALAFLLSSAVSPHFNTSIYGNSFRDQGLITHLLIIGMAYVVYKSVNRKNFYLIAFSFIFSAIIQSGIAYSQAVKLIQTDPKALLEGYWVNGTFGQANFFSGRLLMGLIFIAYYIGHNLRIKFAWIIKIFLSLSAIFVIGALLFSLSIWGIITASAAFVVILLYELLPKRIFPYLFFIIATVSLVGGIFYIAQSTEYNLRVEIWKGIFSILFTQAESKNMILGYGFDTLGIGFRDFGYFSGVLIDRAHNFFLDILFQVGVVGFGILVLILSKPIIIFRKNAEDRKFTFAFFALFFWLLRSFIHESGIVNMVDFLIVLALALGIAGSKNSKIDSDTEIGTNIEEFEKIAEDNSAYENRIVEAKENSETKV